MARRWLAVALSLFALAAEAQNKYLIPVIYREPIPGAFGSLWRSTLTVHNRANRTVEGVGLYQPCSAGVCVAQLLAKETVEGIPDFTVLPGKNGPGDFLWVGIDTNYNLSLSLRVQDVSRLADRWGTDIPVIPYSGALTRTAHLLGVPTDARYRQMLRIYDFDSRENARVEIEFFTYDGVSLGRREVKLDFAQYRPAYAEIAWLTAEFPQIAAHEQVRLEVRPLTGGLRFWTFVSVTNNTNQEITNIYPSAE